MEDCGAKIVDIEIEHLSLARVAHLTSIVV